MDPSKTEQVWKTKAEAVDRAWRAQYYQHSGAVGVDGGYKEATIEARDVDQALELALRNQGGGWVMQALTVIRS